MPAPVVSILSPTYNHGPYIAQCIESVLAQSYPHWEMIILDDGSTDDTYTIAKTYAEKDERIKVFTQQNKGIFRLGETYNFGLEQSLGKYIAILEGDDTWEPNKLEIQVPVMENNPLVVLSWGLNALVNADNLQTISIQPNVTGVPENLLNNDPQGSVIELLLLNVWLPALTLFIRKDALMKIGGFLQSYGMPLVDFPTLLTLSKLGPFHFDPVVLGNWRIYSTQTTKKHTMEMTLGMKAFVYDWAKEALKGNDSKQKQIRKYFEERTLVAYARSGRYKLIRKEFKSARHDYLKAITYPSGMKLSWRLRALIGFTLSYFKTDVEWLAGLLGKTTYKAN